MLADGIRGGLGRDREIAALRAVAASLTEGPATMLIEGEAGIGKTTLWHAGIDAARERSWRVLASRPGAAETSLSFAALGDLLGPVVEDAVSGLPPPQRRALAAALLLEEDHASAPDQRAVAIGFLGSLRALAARGPVVVAVDDVQWLDAASALVLGFAMRRLRDEAIGFLLAQRPASRPPRLPFGEDVSRLVVGPLSLGAVHRLASERLGVVLARPALRRLHEVSGGNPLFALELARALQRGGVRSTPAEPPGVPPTLRDLVGERLGALPEEAQQALRVAASLSRPTVGVVASATEVGAAALDVAVQAQVIELDGEEIRFVHPLYAAGAYAAIPPRRRLELHARLAELVDDTEARARHLGLATTGPDAAVAAELEHAARLARNRGAPATAAELAEQARHHTPPRDVPARLRRTGHAGRYWFEAGDTEGARRMLQEASSSAPRGRERAWILAILARVHLYEGDELRAAELLRRVLQEAGDDLRLRSEAEQALSTVHLFRRHDLAAGARHARAAVRHAEALGDTAAIGIALGQLGVVEGLRGRPAAERVFERALSLADGAIPMAIQHPSYCYSDYLLRTDRFEEARRRLDAAHAQARADGDESSLTVILGDIGLLESLRGRWADAAQAVEEGNEIAVQTAQRPWHAYVLAVRALLGAHRGRTAQAERDSERALELAGEGGMYAQICATSALGLLALSLGDPARADRHLRPLADRLAEAGVKEPGDTRFVADAVEALVRIGRLGEARRLLDPFEAQARRRRRASALATALRCRALLASANHDAESAVPMLERALVHHDRVTVPLERGRTLLELGSALRRAQRRREARGRLGEATRTFQTLGAPLWEQRAHAELGRIGGRVASRDALTPAERRIAGLVAEGRTNREVGAALFVTEHTVESHLSRIYAKLGVRSRTELARRLEPGA